MGPERGWGASPLRSVCYLGASQKLVADPSHDSHTWGMDEGKKGDGVRLSALVEISDFDADYYWPNIPLLLILGDEAGFAETGVIRPPGASCSSTGVLDLGAEVATCPISLDALVVPVCSKRAAGSALPISLGRSPARDVCLNHSSISKYHAQFAQPTGCESWRIRDIGSLNGTWVEGLRLETDRAYHARGFSDMTFGTLHCRFLMPGALTALVHMIAETQSEKSAADTDPDIIEDVAPDDPRRREETQLHIPRLKDRDLWFPLQDP